MGYVNERKSFLPPLTDSQKIMLSKHVQNSPRTKERPQRQHVPKFIYDGNTMDTVSCLSFTGVEDKQHKQHFPSTHDEPPLEIVLTFPCLNKRTTEGLPQRSLADQRSKSYNVGGHSRRTHHTHLRSTSMIDISDYSRIGSVHVNNNIHSNLQKKERRNVRGHSRRKDHTHLRSTSMIDISDYSRLGSVHVNNGIHFNRRKKRKQEIKTKRSFKRDDSILEKSMKLERNSAKSKKREQLSRKSIKKTRKFITSRTIERQDERAQGLFGFVFGKLRNSYALN